MASKSEDLDIKTRLALEDLDFNHRIAIEKEKELGHVPIGDFVTQSKAELFRTTTREIYAQHVKDPNNNLLIDGFFRETMPRGVLPPEVNQMISIYYLKSYSVEELRLKVIRLSMYMMILSE